MRRTGRFDKFPPDLAAPQCQCRIEWSTLFGNKSFQKVALAFQEHLAHLIRVDFALQNGFAHFEGTTSLGDIFADVGNARVVDLSTFADLAFTHYGVLLGIDDHPIAVPIAIKLEFRLVLTIQY